MIHKTGVGEVLVVRSHKCRSVGIVAQFIIIMTEIGISVRPCPRRCDPCLLGDNPHWKTRIPGKRLAVLSLFHRIGVLIPLRRPRVLATMSRRNYGNRQRQVVALAARYMLSPRVGREKVIHLSSSALNATAFVWRIRNFVKGQLLLCLCKGNLHRQGCTSSSERIEKRPPSLSRTNAWMWLLGLVYWEAMSAPAQPL